VPGYAGFESRSPLSGSGSTRHSRERPLQAFEEVEQAVARFETARFSVDRFGFRQDFLLQGEVCLEIHLSRFDGRMAEPQSNHGEINPGLHQLHGCGVAKDMRRDSFAGERWAAFFRGHNVLVHEILNGVSAHLPAGSAWEQERRFASSLFFDPRAQNLCGRPSQWRIPFPAAFAETAHMSYRSQRYILLAKAGEFR